MTTYRKLTDTEAEIIRLALGEFIPANWDLLPSWKPELRDPILAAQMELHTQEFEFATHNQLHILAIRGDSTYAITPELQNGIKMEHVRAVLKTFGPWNWKKFLRNDLNGLWIFILCSAILFLIFPPEPIRWLGEFDTFFVSTWGQLCFGTIALIFLGTSLYQNNPIRHYREQAELGHEILAYLSQKTPAEIEADNARILRNMPTKEQVMFSQGIGTKGEPKPA